MSWVSSNLGVIAASALAHAALSAPTVVLSFVLSVPIGWLAHRYRLTRGTLLAVAGVLYAIPSIPLFVILPIVIGTSARSPLNVVIALTLYGIALMVRSSADAFDAVERDVVDSATAVGFAGMQRFFRVELPLAGPVLLAGLRVVSVSTVSLVTVSGVLGIPSLGLLFTDGFQRGITEEILAGIVATVVLALLFDVLLVLAGRVLMPWARATARRAPRARTREARA